MEPEVKSVPEVSGEVAAVEQKRPNALFRAVRWTFVGEGGLRAGWSIFLFFVFDVVFVAAIGMIFSLLHLTGKDQSFTAAHEIVNLMMMVPAIAASAWLLAKINHHRFDAYYLSGQKRVRRLAVGLLAGFAAVSLLMGALYVSGVVQFGQVALSGVAIWEYAALWGAAFILVGFNEEGTFRCFMQYVLSRSITFVTAVITFISFVAVMGSIIFITSVVKSKELSVGVGKVAAWLTGSPMLGVYLMFVLGLLVCVWFYRQRSDAMKFWLAAWIGSTLFGLVHTGNGGENWIGIFSAAAIGYIFCVSVKLTGSVWWAIGFHAAWDWGLTYFYGAADSGNPAAGHFLSTNPVGNPLLSGGADGPEGSLLILPLLVVVLAVLVFAYRKKRAVAETAEIEAS